MTNSRFFNFRLILIALTFIGMIFIGFTTNAEPPKNGLYKTYYENGRLGSEINYKNGELEGVEKSYYINGNIKREVIWKNNEAISGYLYGTYGQKRRMTNAHLHNLMTTRPWLK